MCFSNFLCVFRFPIFQKFFRFPIFQKFFRFPIFDDFCCRWKSFWICRHEFGLRIFTSIARKAFTACATKPFRSASRTRRAANTRTWTRASWRPCGGTSRPSTNNFTKLWGKISVGPRFSGWPIIYIIIIFFFFFFFFFFEGLYFQENFIWKTSILKTRSIKSLNILDIYYYVSEAAEVIQEIYFVLYQNQEIWIVTA